MGLANSGLMEQRVLGLGPNGNLMTSAVKKLNQSEIFTSLGYVIKGRAGTVDKEPLQEYMRTMRFRTDMTWVSLFLGYTRIRHDHSGGVETVRKQYRSRSCRDRPGIPLKVCSGFSPFRGRALQRREPRNKRSSIAQYVGDSTKECARIGRVSFCMNVRNAVMKNTERMLTLNSVDQEIWHVA